MRRDPRSVKIAVFEAPQDDAVPESPGDAGGKPSTSGAVFLVDAGPEDFVQRAQRQTAARQEAVDRGDAEREHPVAQRVRTLDPPDAVLQGDKASSI